MNRESMFEAVDATGDEQYWTLGWWPTLDEALAELEKCADPAELDTWGYHEPDDICVVEIRERKMGWGDQGVKRATVTWRREYRDDDADEGVWRRGTVKEATDAPRP